MRLIKKTDIGNPCGTGHYYKVSKETAKKFDDAGEWVFGYKEGKDWIIAVGCLPENLDDVLYDEFNRVGLNCEDFENG